ncbi:MAG TPA: alpha/beta hydrolase, partial [Stellaceae bacterium]|nr:alpha/beta hydrolase [Stellaceae bacterium]
MTGFKSHYITANGIRIHYLREGRGPALLLLHGWPEFCRVWQKCIPALSAEFEVIAPDLRGFGDTEKPSHGPSAEAGADVHAADVLALMDGLGLERVGIVSHDVGAYAAQSLAHAHPDRLRGLFFFNCPYAGIGARWAAPEHLSQIWYQSFHQQPWAAALVGNSRETCRAYIGHFLRHWAHDPHAFDEDLEAWVDNFMKPGNLQGGFNWYISAHQA